jgi:hypothetical protein
MVRQQASPAAKCTGPAARGRGRERRVLYLPAMALMLVDRKSHRGVAASERWPAS